MIQTHQVEWQGQHWVCLRHERISGQWIESTMWVDVENHT